MEKSSVPPPEPTTDNNLPVHRHVLRAVLPLLVVVIVIVASLLMASRKDSNSGSSAKAHLLLNNSSKSQLLVSDASGKTTYSLNYPKFSYMNFEAASPKGEVLLSQSPSVGSDYTFAVSGKDQKLPVATVKVLDSAIVLGNSRQLYFSDENDIIYATCAKTCQLMSVNLQSGKTQKILDSGAKPILPQLPAAYPLGLSADHKTIYVRTTLANKLGKTAAAVYALSLSGKVTGSWAVPAAADYTPRLSPDGQQIVYKADGAKSQTKLSVLNLKTGKTYSANWTKGEIVDSPSSFAWSPDSQKVLFWGSNSILPNPDLNHSSDINLAYLDAANSQLKDLQTVKDSAHNRISSLGWLDKDNVIYERDTTSQANTFSSPAPQIYKQNVASKTFSKFNNLSGTLMQSIFY